MKIKIFYQDFRQQANLHLSKKISFVPGNAVLIYEIDLNDPEIVRWSKVMGVKLNDEIPRDILCDIVYAKMNHLDVPKGHPDREIFERAGHTSMSIGDYIEFDDGNDGKVWICSPNGWSKYKKEHLIAMY
jgi:hypothetical protein